MNINHLYMYIEYALHVLKNNNVASQVIGVIAIEFGFRTVSRQLLWRGVYGSNTGGHHVRQYPVMRAHSAGTVDSKQAWQQLLSIYYILFIRIFVFYRHFICSEHIFNTNNSITMYSVQIGIIILWRCRKKLKTQLCLPR